MKKMIGTVFFRKYLGWLQRGSKHGPLALSVSIIPLSHGSIMLLIPAVTNQNILNLMGKKIKTKKAYLTNSLKLIPGADLPLISLA